MIPSNNLKHLQVISTHAMSKNNNPANYIIIHRPENQNTLLSQETSCLSTHEILNKTKAVNFPASRDSQVQSIFVNSLPTVSKQNLHEVPTATFLLATGEQFLNVENLKTIQSNSDGTILTENSTHNPDSLESSDSLNPDTSPNTSDNVEDNLTLSIDDTNLAELENYGEDFSQRKTFVFFNTN